MIRIRRGTVQTILSRRPGITAVLVEIPGESTGRAYNYDAITGPVAEGDGVLLNTTAVAKNLGTGGAHFVMANLTSPEKEMNEPGHIMKLRYTPGQVKVLAAEEPESPVAEKINRTESLDGLPVVIGTLHSMLAPAAAGIRAAMGQEARIVYIMTDGAALPLWLSELVYELKQKGLIDAAITCGHAFGGDWETINVYTALQAAVAAAKADAVIVAMGPGIVGSASKFGFTGVEQGEIVNAVNILAGEPVAIPRISFADQRERHRGISHHTITALGSVALTPSTIVFPRLPHHLAAIIGEQAKAAGLDQKHRLATEDGAPALELLQQQSINVKSMGRTIQDDPAFFLAAGAAGIHAGKMAVGRKD
ncbi:Protein of unknown function [Desulfotomaculum arcticum]|uniref:DUF3866 domain-containing protein n=1 Tax=Desulfotruncus arcticus DSM 17038 TaxID=1121424 RepID=A0A1I2MSK5_9FIRM|nr:DUF3866 family protein [Desulfotruncus arcticus]SFF94098.1 Protein of unknown function [Desulfotomaculum arcticum] [Desulfotruncus arcticus DSM 17038]